jgi:hypothetical protein
MVSQHYTSVASGRLQQAVLPCAGKRWSGQVGQQNIHNPFLINCAAASKHRRTKAGIPIGMD